MNKICFLATSGRTRARKEDLRARPAARARGSQLRTSGPGSSVATARAGPASSSPGDERRLFGTLQGNS